VWAESHERESSSLLAELVLRLIGVGPPPATPALPVVDLQVGGAAVDVVLAEGRAATDEVGVEHVGLLPCLPGDPLLGEALVLHQVGVVGVLPALGHGQGVLRRTKHGAPPSLTQSTAFHPQIRLNACLFIGFHNEMVCCSDNTATNSKTYLCTNHV